jgi:hypothetical protein
MDIVASPAVRSGHQGPRTRRHGGMVPQAILFRPVACGPAIAIIPVDELLRAMPLGMRGPIGVEVRQWVRNGRRL